MPPLNKFAWQEEFEQKFLAHTETHFFLCALPGGGKTRASIRVMKKLKAQGYKFVVVVPTIPVKNQWKKQARKYGGIELMDGGGFLGKLRDPKIDGIAMTYAAVANRTSALRMFCANNPVLVIMDEIHHASPSDNAVWGQALTDAFADVKRGLQLSGTPLRSDCLIPAFLKLRDPETEIELDPMFTGGNSIPYVIDFPYDWPRALTDGVVRNIVFHKVASDKIDVLRASGAEDVVRSDEDEWLSKVIRKPKFYESIIQGGIAKLVELRKTDPTAAGLILVSDTAQAKIITQYLRKLGERAIEVHTALEEKEQETSAKKLADFAAENCPDQWVVAVRQVSEGVDIPRLRVEIYLTNICTELAFRQAAGRIVRRREGEKAEDAVCHMFIPDTPRLVAFAETIEELQALAACNIEEREARDGDGDPGSSYDNAGADIVVDIDDPYNSGFIIGGNAYTQSHVEALVLRFGVPELAAAKLLDSLGPAAFGLEPSNVTDDGDEDVGAEKGSVNESAAESERGETDPEVAPAGVPVEERMKSLQAEISRLVTRFAYAKTGLSSGARYTALVKDIHRKTNPYGKSQNQLSLDELERKKERVLGMIARHRSGA